MVTLVAILIIAIIGLSIYALVKPSPHPALAVAVLLVGILEALTRFGNGVIR